MIASMASDDDVWFPIVLKLGKDSRALVVGGGEVAANKVELLLPTHVRITVLAPDLCPSLQNHVARGAVIHRQAMAEESNLHELLPGCRLVFTATDDPLINRLVTRLAGEMNIPACAVDDPEPSSFITPAIVRRGPVRVAISTAGAAPVLARRLREQIEALLPARLGELASFMRRLRPKIKIDVPDAVQRRRVWEQFMDGAGASAAMDMQPDKAEAELSHLINVGEKRGEVWLVGAGPGDADLLTVAALRYMQNADSVLYDHLLPIEIMDRVRRDAERIFVGKQRADHALPQPLINEELIRRAKAGERVLRLKGGDPFIFGRGGEEIEALLEAGIPFRVIPGVSAANGCAAASGIPLTHRDCAQSCVFLTGHARADGTLDLPWHTIALKGQTVVIYMGVAGLRDLSASMVACGLPDDWPVAVIEKGTRPDQRVLTGVLSDIADKARDEGIRSPALIIVGEVVRHRVVSPTV
ncbi:MAG: siroheme synthase CysG [Acetobacter sp.]|jgi:uroporphyrin-III C-methyltransferase/precorrin-2 dehydrogenase/sirohydrochlorin ferrochelatase|nr:siroheme synthase CysG [Acetobacter sp.]MCI1294639.1 siroheme synthase CysG [Acetobacter sp.]MCI1321311.1 siroheme synthase CysG [Acetobacter sp.]MCI1374626.1 siroheme synthase CysG [Acetobacter sp.]MCI1414523.1 siroheme synthase CysG [Acetobacter sp.]